MGDGGGVAAMACGSLTASGHASGLLLGVDLDPATAMCSGRVAEIQVRADDVSLDPDLDPDQYRGQDLQGRMTAAAKKGEHGGEGAGRGVGESGQHQQQQRQAQHVQHQQQPQRQQQAQGKVQQVQLQPQHSQPRSAFTLLLQVGGWGGAGCGCFSRRLSSV